MHSRFAFKVLASLTFAAVGLAACGDDDDNAGTTAAPAAETTAAPTAETTPAPVATTTTAAAATTTAAAATTSAPAGTSAAAGGATLSLAQSDLGSIVADGEGRTLYLFMKDTGGTSACEGSCAQSWPPLTVQGAAVAGEGIDEDDLGTITRSDGSTQVTFYGHPLYYFASDVGAGDTSGQGVGGVWFVVDAEGNAVQG